MKPTAADNEPFSPIVIDARMQAIFRLVEQLAPAPIPILLLGETGCGKEVIADWVHRSSQRRACPLVRINCAGLTESVVESELFGHEKGAFTNALASHRGLFEVADGGTLFLDEVAELPLRTQAKLLRVLESGEFMRLGSTEQRKVSVRIIAATHDELMQLIQRGAFRRDLYFRLSGATIGIPPLRERRLEILPLARMFLTRCRDRGCTAASEIASDALAALLEHTWPGNLRELRNVMECASAMAGGGVVRAGHLSLDNALRWVGLQSATPAGVSTSRLPEILPGKLRETQPCQMDMRTQRQAFERTQIMAALGKTGGNQTQAAKVLGIARRTLTNKLNAYDIERPRKRAAQVEAPGDGRPCCGDGT